MTDKPLTEKDIERVVCASFLNASGHDSINLRAIQSAKRLLKQKLTFVSKTFIGEPVFTQEEIHKQIDACFQIDDGEDKE